VPDTEFTLVTGSAAAVETDALIIALRTGDDGPTLAGGADDVAEAFGDSGEELLALLKLAGASGKADEVVKLPTRGTISAKLLVAVGLGKAPEGPTAQARQAEQVRRAAGAASRALGGTASAVSTLSRMDLTAAAEGGLLGTYSFTTYKSSGKGKGPLGSLGLLAPAAVTDPEPVLVRAIAVAGAVRTARDLINTPPNDLFPASFADRAADIGAGAGLEVEILDERELADGGYGGILGVGIGSSRPPRLVKVALVGKGITFDTGGISIKPAANMDHMTSDMSGAAAVIATVGAGREAEARSR
jgi:leucyl aminopeptidase